MSFRSRATNEAIKKILRENANDYKESCHRSREDYIKTLRYGDQIPKEGNKFYNNTDREAYRERCLNRQREARKILASETAALKAETVKAPDAEAVSILSLMAIRSDLTEQELVNMMDKYGSNYQTAKTIHSLANDHKFRNVPTNPIDDQLERIENLDRTLESCLSIDSAEKGHTSDGFISFLSLDIDSAFPTE